MIHSLRDRPFQRSLAAWLIAAAVLALAFLLGRRASPFWLVLLAAGMGAVLLLARPAFGLLVMVVASLVVPLQIGTGTEVKLNAASMLPPALLALWLLHMLRRRNRHLAGSRANRPLLLFLAAGLISLLIGRATWDPMVPISSNFLLVQLAQWGIFAFSAAAFWLTANLVGDETWLRRLTVTFLLLGGGMAVLRGLPDVGALVAPVTTIAFIRTPFWVLLTALAAGQLLFNRALSLPWRAFLVLVVGTSLVYAFVNQREAISNWVGLAAVLGILFWLRFPLPTQPL